MTAADSRHRQVQSELSPDEWALTGVPQAWQRGGRAATVTVGTAGATSPCPGGPPGDILEGPLPPGSEMPMPPVRVTSSFLAGHGEDGAHDTGHLPGS